MKNYGQNYAKYQVYLTAPVGFFSTLWCKESNAQTSKAEPPFVIAQLPTEIEKGYALLGQCHIPSVLRCPQCKNTIMAL